MAMASGRDRNVTVTPMNNFVYLYLDELGLTEEAKQEFLSKANEPNLGLEAFESYKVWKIITEPSQILQKMEAMGPFEFEVAHSTDSASVNNSPANKFSTFSLPLIDLNALPDGQVAPSIEDEDSTTGKRKMIDCTLRL